MFSQESNSDAGVRVVTSLSDNHYYNHSFIAYTYNKKVTMWGEPLECKDCTKRLNQATVLKQDENGEIVAKWNIDKPLQSKWTFQKIYNDTIYLLLRSYGDTLFVNKDTFLIPNGALSLFKFDLDLKLIDAYPLVISNGGGGISAFMSLDIIENEMKLALTIRGDYELGKNLKPIDFNGFDYHVPVLSYSKNGEYKSVTTPIIDDFVQIKGLVTKGDKTYLGAMINNAFLLKGKKIPGISGVEYDNETDFVIFEYKDTALVNYYQLGTGGSDDGNIYDFSEKRGLLFGMAIGSKELTHNDKVIASFNSVYNSVLLRLHNGEFFIEKKFESPEIDGIDCTDPTLNSVQYLEGNKILVGVNYNDELIVGEQVFKSSSKLTDLFRRNSIMLVIGGDSIKSRLLVSSPGVVNGSFSGVNSDYEVMVYGYASDTVYLADVSYPFSSPHSFQINLCIDSFETSTKEYYKGQSDFAIYPNPARNTLSIKGVNNFNKVEVFNVHGQLMDLEPISNGILDVSSLPKGIYIFKIESDNNYTKAVSFVKE